MSRRFVGFASSLVIACRASVAPQDPLEQPHNSESRFETKRSRDVPRAAAEQARLASFFRTCDPGMISGVPPTLAVGPDRVAHCGRLFSLSTGRYVGLVPAGGRLLAILSDSGVLERRQGGLRLVRQSGHETIESPGGEILALAISADEQLIATLEAPVNPALSGVLVVRSKSTLAKVFELAVNAAAVTDGRARIAFLGRGSLAYIDGARALMTVSLESGHPRRLEIEPGFQSAWLAKDGTSVLVERGRTLEYYELDPVRRVWTQRFSNHESIAGAVPSGRGQFVVWNGETLLVYRATKQGYVPRAVRLGAASGDVDAERDWTAIAIEDGMLVLSPRDFPAPRQARSAESRAASLSARGFAVAAPSAADLAKWSARKELHAVDDENIRLTVEALPRDLLARFEDTTLDTWSRTAAEYVLRTSAEPWVSDPNRLYGVWRTPDGQRAIELRVGLKPGETCADDQRYVRFQELKDGVLYLELRVPLGTPSRRVRGLLRETFDAALGPPPRTVPEDRDPITHCP